MYLYIKYGDGKIYESFQNLNNRCPNILIEKNNKIYLYNSKLVKVPGVNPIEFENLEDYVEFLDWQRNAGIRCPVLYLQKGIDIQGNDEYKIRPNILEKQGGLNSEVTTSTLLIDASRNDNPYNENSYPGYDQTSFYVGDTTPLDKMNNDQGVLISPNAMDDKWGGQAFTQKLVDKGYYKDNEVKIYIP
jgi:hypothetical protein